MAVPPWFARRCEHITDKTRDHVSSETHVHATIIEADLELFLQECWEVARRLAALAPVAVVVLAGIFPVSKSLRRRVIRT